MLNYLFLSRIVVNGFIYFFCLLWPIYSCYGNYTENNYDLIEEVIVDLPTMKYVIEQLESTGGYNTNHKTITYGIHNGHRAVGSLGLMLNSAKEMAMRRKLKNTADELDLQLINEITKQEEFEEFITKNPHKYENYTNDLLKLVHTRSGGDLFIAAVMWRWGHNLSKEQAKSILQNNSTYKKRIVNIIK